MPNMMIGVSVVVSGVCSVYCVFVSLLSFIPIMMVGIMSWSLYVCVCVVCCTDCTAGCTEQSKASISIPVS